MHNSFCSPKHQDVYDNDKTCFTKSNLIIIAQNLNNASHLNQQMQKIKLRSKKQELYKHIKKTIRTLYNADIHESQWLTLNVLQQVKQNARNELNEVFRPAKPYSWNTNDKTWLNTYDILNVMIQYEKKYPSFKFLGVSAINYNDVLSENQCVTNTLCNINVKHLLQLQYSQIGVIFNLDKHDEPGSHWVCFYAGLSPNLKNFGCYYIDSTGTDFIPREVEQLALTLTQQINHHYKDKKIRKQFQFVKNKKQFQFKNSECGMFSMFFLIQFLKKCTFQQLINTNINDEKVHKFRNIYYRPSVN